MRLTLHDNGREFQTRHQGGNFQQNKSEMLEVNVNNSVGSHNIYTGERSNELK